MGFLLYITGEVQGVSEASYAKIARELDDTINTMGSHSVTCYRPDHQRIDFDGQTKLTEESLERVFERLASAIDPDNGRGELTLSLLDASEDNLSKVFFVPGKWARAEFQIVEPENPFDKVDTAVSAKKLQTVEDLVKTVQRWHAEAPIAELEAVEAALDWNFPSSELNLALDIIKALRAKIGG